MRKLEKSFSTISFGLKRCAFEKIREEVTDYKFAYSSVAAKPEVTRKSLK